MKDDLNMWVYLVESRLSAFHFGGANAIGVVEDLAVQVRQVDRVRINDANSSDASGSKIK